MEDDKNTLGNTDKIYNAYKGDLGKEFQQSTRERFSWQASVIKGEKILDIGCSQGILPILLAREGKYVLGIDIFKDAIRFANKLKSEETKSTQDNVEFIQGDFLKLNIKEKFDTIILGETLEHFFYPNKLIKEIQKNLKENGVVIATVPFGINDYYDHRKTYYLYDLLELFSNNFEIIDIKYSEIRRNADWIGIVAEKTKSTKQFTYVKKEFLKDFESHIYLKDRRYEEIISTIQKDLQEKNHENSKLLKKIEKESINNKSLSEKVNKQQILIEKFKSRKIIKLINSFKKIFKK